MTWESDRPIDLATWDLNQGLASMAFVSSPPCSTVGVCLAVNDNDLGGGGLQSLLFVIDMIQPTDPSSFTGIGNPVLLGLMTTTDPLAIGPRGQLRSPQSRRRSLALVLGVSTAALRRSPSWSFLSRRQRCYSARVSPRSWPCAEAAARLRSALGMQQSATDKLVKLI